MTFKDLRLKEVINCCDGAKLGAVVDLKFCPETGKIEELLVAGTGKCFQLFFSNQSYFLVTSLPFWKMFLFLLSFLSLSLFNITLCKKNTVSSGECSLLSQLLVISTLGAVIS